MGIIGGFLCLAMGLIAWVLNSQAAINDTFFSSVLTGGTLILPAMGIIFILLGAIHSRRF